MIVRLKRWKTYLDDGRGFAEFTTGDPKIVGVFIRLGFEPLRPIDNEETVDVDEVILKMAAHIRKKRKERKATDNG